MVATRRSHSLDAVKVGNTDGGKRLSSRNRSSSVKKPLASTTSNSIIEYDDEELPVRHSARLRGESPQLPNARRGKNTSRSLNDNFEWDVQKINRGAKIGSNFETSRNMEDFLEKGGKREKKRTEIRNLLAAEGKDFSDMKSHAEPDIYSSVKSRVRVSTRKKLYQEYYTSSSSRNKPGEVEEEEEESQSEGTEDEDGQVNEEQDTEEEEEEEEEDEDEGHPYKLRKIREAPKRYMIVREVQRRRPRSIFEDLPCSPVRRRRKNTPGTPSHNPYQKRRRRARTQGNSSTSESDGSSDDEIKFRKRQKKSMARVRNECLPMNISAVDLGKHSYGRERKKIGQSLADIDPMALDTSVTFSSIGGHNKHIRALKEMVVFPLLYPEVFQKFSITPPRGCLFYGPPGTGKTLMARALANECSTKGKTVSFFMKKGADCLSKWIGESERQLRVLFDQAYQMRPSIIFFDEIDGLAPVRSSRQDQIHSSIVSTLLALMDGLDSRGEIIIIGATNRIDSIDPALRRPGRFDREFLFPLPDKNARETIVQIHTKAWNPQLKPSFIEYLATRTVGYCGADLKALCTEAALIALRRRYPQIYESREKLQLDIDAIKIEAADFRVAVKNIIPTAQRSVSNPGRALSSTIKPLMGRYLQKAVLQLAKLFPVLKGKSKLIQRIKSQDADSQSGTTIDDHTNDDENDSELGSTMQGIYVGEPEGANPINSMLPPLLGSNNGIVQSKYSELLRNLSSTEYSLTAIHRPHFLICGNSSSGHVSHLTPALLHDMEGIPIHCLDLPALYGISVRTPEESCAQVFREARRLTPSIIYLPNMLQWWTVASPTIKATLESLLQDIPPNLPVLFLATANCSYLQLPRELAKVFHSDFYEVYEMKVNFDSDMRREFFAPIFLIHAVTAPTRKRSSGAHREVLSKAPAPEPAPLTEEEEKKLEKEEESTLRNLRVFLRDVLMRLERDRRFKIFSKPVDPEEVPDYVGVIKSPMDFSTMHTKVDQYEYQTVQMFLKDVDLICNNALEYNPDRRPEDKLIRHRACAMRDMAHAIVDTDMEPEFDKLCQEIIESRKRRGVTMNKFAPKFYPVLPKHLMVNPITGEITPKLHLEQPTVQENNAEETAEKILWKRQQKKTANAMKPRRKRSSWSRGIVSRAKKKKVVSMIESSEDGEDGGEEEDAKMNQEKENKVEAPTKYDSNEGVEGELICEDQEEEENLVRRVDEENLKPIESLSTSFESGTEMEIDVGQAVDKYSAADQDCESKKTDEDSHQILNGYGLDDIQQDEIVVTCWPGIVENRKRSADYIEDEGKCEKYESQKLQGQDIIEICEESEKDPTPPRKMTLRTRGQSTSESNPIDKEPEEPPPPLIVGHKCLLELLEEVVSITDSYTLEELERAHTSLSRCVDEYRMKYDRSDLSQDLELEIRSLPSSHDRNTSDQANITET